MHSRIPAAARRGPCFAEATQDKRRHPTFPAFLSSQLIGNGRTAGSTDASATRRPTRHSSIRGFAAINDGQRPSTPVNPTCWRNSRVHALTHLPPALDKARDKVKSLAGFNWRRQPPRARLNPGP